MIVKYIGVAAPVEAVEKYLVCICVRWSISDEMDYIVCDKDIKHGVVKAKGRYVH